MLEKKSFFNKKTLTILISAIVILAVLIVVVATGIAHNPCTDCGATGEVSCVDCGGDGLISNVQCETCGGDLNCGTCNNSGVIERECETCVDTIGKVACETCGGLGKVYSSIWALLPPIIAIGLALCTPTGVEVRRPFPTFQNTNGWGQVSI